MSPRKQILFVRVFSGVIVLLALVLAFGISNQFTILDAAIAASCLILGITCLLQRYNKWALAFFAFAFLFNPFLRIAGFPRYLWVIFDILLIGYVAVFAIRTTNPYWKGTAFEQYVSTLFSPSDFDMVDRTRDISKFSKRIVESDSHPDLVFRKKKSGEMFAVECKYASRWHFNKTGNGIYLRQYQLDNYRKYSKERNIPVYIAFGVGGNPEKPKEVFFVPLDQIKYDFVWESLIRSGKKVEEV